MKIFGRMKKYSLILPPKRVLLCAAGYVCGVSLPQGGGT